MDLLTSINHFAEEQQIDKGAPYLVGVSGGRDSIALLHALLECEFSQLTVCHLNHGLRAEQSDGDEAFVKELCNKLGIPFRSEKVDLSCSPESMETAARNARYTFFQKVANAEILAKVETEVESEAEITHSYPYSIFLAHHADDQAETILFNLLRGSATLQGIKSVTTRTVGDSSDQKITLLRPLLNLRREAINEFIREHKLNYREDHTNALPVAARNRIRNELIPLANDILKRDITPILTRSLNHSAKLEDFLKSQLDYPSLVDPQGRLYLPAFTELHEALQSIAMNRFLKHHQVTNISQDLILKSIQLANNTEGTAKMNLSGNKFLRRRAKRLFMEN
ncbi:tRNA lysidine(34) synthetase TilS [Akkermansiaceae bacterium]|nr:tRNA lysidine(34) synthetase TilS [Akkermansiaceae bacterium]